MESLKNNLNEKPEPGSLDWHIANYRGPLWWLRGLDTVPDLLLTHHNTYIHRFADPELDHLRVEDLARKGLVWLLRAKKLGAAILDDLESQDFRVVSSPLPDAVTEEVFVGQEFTMPPVDVDPAAGLSRPSHY